MQMRRQTQTNMLVLWISTYRTQPEPEITPASEQICPLHLRLLVALFASASTIISFQQLSRSHRQTGASSTLHRKPSHIKGAFVILNKRD